MRDRPGLVRDVVRAVIVLAGAAIVAPASLVASDILIFSGGEWMTPAFRAGDSRPSRLAILMPHAEMYKDKMIMVEDMINEATVLEESAAGAVSHQLQRRGYEVKTVVVDELSRETRELVRRVNARLDEERPRFGRNKIQQGVYTMGDDAVRLATALDVDGLALTRMSIRIASGGLKWLSIISPEEYERSWALVDVAVISGDDGGLEAFFIHYEPCKSKSLLRKPDKIMAQVLRKALHDYPDNGEVLPVRRRADQLDEDGGEPDESALAEFEALVAASEAEVTSEGESGASTAGSEEEAGAAETGVKDKDASDD